jgi:hypothetical protein
MHARATAHAHAAPAHTTLMTNRTLFFIYLFVQNWKTPLHWAAEKMSPDTVRAIIPAWLVR